NAGVMALRGDIALEFLGAVHNRNAKGEFYLTDVVAIAEARGERAAVVTASEDEVQGVNDRLQLADAERTIQARLRRNAMRDGALGAGAKVNHLSYVGDATVGADANIGAGTITCNYDGFAKHRTSIGRGAFIGTNSSLVAPVSIGDRAYVGSGSVITDDVPAEALALGR